MGYYSKHPEELRRVRIDHINTRWSQLHELEKEWGEKAIKYLLLTNSGGAIATLSFLGASKTALDSLGAKVALFLFILGVFLVGVMTAKQFHFASGLFKTYKNDVEKYFNDNMQWKDLITGDEGRAKEDFFDYAIPYLSFACFVFGCIAGACTLFSKCA